MESLQPLSPLPTLSPATINTAELYPEKRYILQHVLRSGPLMECAGDALSAMQYFHGFPELQAIFDFSLDFAKEAGKPPGKSTLQLNMDSILSPNSVNDGLRTAALAWLNVVYRDGDDTLDCGFVERIIQQDHSEHLRKAYQARIAISQGEDVDEATERYMKDSNSPLFGAKLTPQSIFDDLEANLALAMRKATGVPIMDLLLCGGTIDGELIGVLAPSGGGKSTIANMLLAACVARRSDCWYMSTEQALAGDLGVRHACLALNTSRDKFKGGYEQLEQGLKVTLESLRDVWSQHCKFVDLSKGDKAIRNVDMMMADVAEEKKRTGQSPGMIIVDWWGRLSDSMVIENGERLKTEAQKRMFDRDQLHHLKKWAEKLGTPVIVFHQLNGAANAKGPNARLSAADAQENKAFNNMFDFCIVLGVRDGDDILRITTDKARGEARQDMKAKLNGAYCRMDVADEPDDVDMDDLTSDLNINSDFGFGDTDDNGFDNESDYI